MNVRSKLLKRVSLIKSMILRASILSNNGTVASMQKKYGRPGISGRKRKVTDISQNDDTNIKVLRIKISVFSVVSAEFCSKLKRTVDYQQKCYLEETERE